MDRYVEFCDSDVVKIHYKKLEEMKTIAASNNKKNRFRMCLQKSVKDSIQEMIICRSKGDYVRPDKHIGISESHTIIEGTEIIVLFSDYGDIIDAFLLERENGYLSYRINKDIYHMTIPITQHAIDLEIKPGPFDVDSNIFPSWAPDGLDEKEASDYLTQVTNECIEILGINRNSQHLILTTNNDF